MTKTIPTNAQQAVLDAIARFPNGVSTEQIEAILATAPNRRTLQRWLIDLIAQGHIHKQGQGRAVKYHLNRTESAAAQIVANPETPTWAETQIPLSPAGREIERRVHQPIVLRHPVGYNQTFLEDYRPNETCYLTQDIGDDLLSHGKTIHSNVPAGTFARQLANRLLTDLSWNSSRLEGNTYSLLETERLLSVGEPASGKNALDAQMILNHKEAIEFLIDAVSDIGFNRYTVLNLHALLSDNLLDAPNRQWSLAINRCWYRTNDVFAPIRATANRHLFRSRARHSRGHSRPIRAGVFCHGLSPSSKTVRGRQQTGLTISSKYCLDKKTTCVRCRSSMF